MSIKIRSEQRVALLLTLISVALLIVVLMVELPVLATMVFGVLVYGSTLFVVRRFVAFRIKPIYQILHNRNAKSVEIERQHKDLVGEVHSELESWAQQSSNEIARLKDNDKYRKDFVGNVSHELKTPIFSIQGYVLTLLDGGIDDPEINRKYLLKTESNIERLINIVQDLEGISKLESNNLVLDLERFDIVELVHEIIESIEFQADERRISIVTTCTEDDRYYVTADRKLISQVIVNLLTNSIKYGCHGGTTKVYFIDIYDKMMIEIQDNGTGMERDMLPRIFERFFRVDKSRSRSQGGTGLGLAIVKHIIEAHNQTITVRSAIGQGSTFSFTLNK